MRNIDTLLIILSGILWGFVGVVTTQIFAFSFSELEIVELRFLFSAIILFIILLLFNKNLLKVKNFWLCLLLGASNFLTCVCYYKAIKYLGGGVACVLLYSSPIFVIIYSKLAYKTPLTVKSVLAVTLCLLGSVISARGGAKFSFKGILWGVGSAFFNSLVSIVGAKASKFNGGITATFYGFISSCLIGLVFIRCGTLVRLYNVKTSVLFIILSGVLTVIPYILYISALKSGQEAKASLLCVSEPITANLIDILLYKKISFFSILGLSLLIIGITIICIKNKTNKGEKIDKQIKQRSFRPSAQFLHRN